MSNKKCKIALNVEIGGKKFKVVDPKDACAVVNKVLAKHEGAEIISPKEYDAMMKNTLARAKAI